MNAFDLGVEDQLLVKLGTDKDPRPEPWGVLYAKPNPDGSRKLCGNCWMWARGETACIIHKRDVQVTREHVCGYHVFGRPMDKWVDLPGLDPVDAKLSGLELVRGGTSCNVCMHYEGDEAKGVCHAVEDGKGRDAPVEGLGCCAAWERE